MVGTVPHDVPRLVQAAPAPGPAEHLWVAYEAGPTGFGLCRTLLALGIRCMVVAPNRVPHDPGRRVKTDKRDARDLARALRAGNLRGIALPEVEQEAVRDLMRAREDCVRALRSVRQQLQGILLRHGVTWEGRSSWTVKHHHGCVACGSRRRRRASPSSTTSVKSSGSCSRVTTHRRSRAPHADARPGAAVPLAPGAPRREHDRRCDAGVRAGRSPPLFQRQQADELHRPHALGALQRLEAIARLDHQGR